MSAPAAVRFANAVRDPSRVVLVEYLAAVRVWPRAAPLAVQALYGPPVSGAVEEICRNLDSNPADVRAVGHAGQLAVGVRRGGTVDVAAIVRGGLTVDEFNDAAAALQGQGWRP